MDDRKLTGLDASQVPRYTFDENKSATRVVVVGGEMPQFNVDAKFAPPVEKEIKTIEIPVIIKEQILEKIEIPVIIKETEIREVHIPNYLTFEKLQIVEVEKPIVVKEFERIEVPVIVTQKEVQIVHVDKLNYKLLFIMQIITFGLILLSKFIK